MRSRVLAIWNVSRSEYTGFYDDEEVAAEAPVRAKPELLLLSTPVDQKVTLACERNQYR